MIDENALFCVYTRLLAPFLGVLVTAKGKLRCCIFACKVSRKWLPVVLQCSGYHVCFTRRRSWARAPVERVYFGVLVAQCGTWELCLWSQTSWMWAGRSWLGHLGQLLRCRWARCSENFRAQSATQPEGSHVYFVCFCSLICPPCVLTTPRGLRFSISKEYLQKTLKLW